MEDSLLGMGFEGAKIKIALSENPSATIEQLIERILSMESPEISFPSAEAMKPATWEDFPELFQIVQSCKENPESFTDIQRMEDNHVLICNLLLQQKAQGKIVTKCYKALSKYLANEIFVKDLAKACVSCSTSEELVTAVSAILERYQQSVKWMIGSMCAAVELVDPSLVAQLIASSKKDDDAALPTDLVGNFVSEWESYVAGKLTAPLDDSAAVSSGLLLPADSLTSSPTPPEIMCQLVPLRTYKKGSRNMLSTDDNDLKTFTGWVAEPIAAFALSRESPVGVPLFRLVQGDRHFYTTDRQDAEELEAKKTWGEKKIVCWVFAAATPFTMPLFAKPETEAALAKTKKKKKKASSDEHDAFHFTYSLAEPTDPSSAKIICHVVPTPDSEAFVSAARPIWLRVARAVTDLVIPRSDFTGVDAALARKCELCARAVGVFGVVDRFVADTFRAIVVAVVNPCSVCKKEMGVIERYCTSGCRSGTDGVLEQWHCSVCNNTQCCSGLYSCCRCCSSCQGGNKELAATKPKSPPTGLPLLAKAVDSRRETILLSLTEVTHSWSTLALADMLSKATTALDLIDTTSRCLSSDVASTFTDSAKSLVRHPFAADLFIPFFEIYFPPKAVAESSKEKRDEALDLLARCGSMFGRAGDKRATPLVEAFSKALQIWATRLVLPLSGGASEGSLKAVEMLANCMTNAVTVAETLTQKENGEPALMPYLWSGLHLAFERVVTSFDGRVEEWANATINVLLDIAEDTPAADHISLEALVTLVSMLKDKSIFLQGFKKRLLLRVGRFRSKSLDEEIKLLKFLRDHTGLSLPTETAFVAAFKKSSELCEEARQKSILNSQMSISILRAYKDLNCLGLSSPLPTSALLSGVVPSHFAEQADKFAAFYLEKVENSTGGTHRAPPINIFWQMGLGMAEVGVGREEGGEVVAVVPSAALPVIHQLQSSGEEALTYNTLRTRCGIPEPLLQGALLSLTAPRHPLLAADKVAADFLFTSDTIFRLNPDGFLRDTAGSARVLVRTVHVGGAAAEVVASLPSGYSAATIIRILRHNKGDGMSQNDLLSAVCEYVRHRAVVNPQDLLDDLDQVIAQGFATRGSNGKISFNHAQAEEWSASGAASDALDRQKSNNETGIVPLAIQHLDHQIPSGGLTRTYSHTAAAVAAGPPSRTGSLTRTLSGVVEAFAVCDREAAVESALSLLSQVSPDFGQTLGVVQTAALMSAFSWDPIKIHRAIAASSKDAVFSATGVLTGAASDEIPNGTCPICFSDVSEGGGGIQLGCGHTGCKECFVGFLKSAIYPDVTAGTAFLPLKLRCPWDPKCKLVVPETTAERNLDGKDFAEYSSALHSEIINSFLRSAQGAVACDCGNVLRCRSANVVVSCPCGEVFCVGCKRLGLINSGEPHIPASCSSMQRYRQLADPTSDRFNVLRMKNCPSCLHAVNKCGCSSDKIVCEGLDKCPNAACDHITCTLCRHEWCWICRGNWKGHKSEWHLSPADEKEKFLKAQEKFTQHTKAQEEVDALLGSAEVLPEQPCRLPLIALLSSLRRTHRVLKYGYIAGLSERLEKLVSLLYNSFTQIEDLLQSSKTFSTESIAKMKADSSHSLSPSDFMDKAVALDTLTKGLGSSWICDWFIRQEAKMAEEDLEEQREVARVAREEQLRTELLRREELEKRREELMGNYRSKRIERGTRVRRGLDWNWGTQDHNGEGIEAVGTVTGDGGLNVWVTVQWDNGGSNSYRWGQDDAWDLLIVSEPAEAPAAPAAEEE